MAHETYDAALAEYRGTELGDLLQTADDLLTDFETGVGGGAARTELGAIARRLAELSTAERYPDGMPVDRSERDPLPPTRLGDALAVLSGAIGRVLMRGRRANATSRDEQPPIGDVAREARDRLARVRDLAGAGQPLALDDDAEQPYLDLIVDRERRTVERRGFELVAGRPVKVDLSTKAGEWHVFVKCLDAGENGTTKLAVLAKYPLDPDGIKVATSKLRSDLIPLGVTIVQRGFRLIESGET